MCVISALAVRGQGRKRGRGRGCMREQIAKVLHINLQAAHICLSA